MPFPLWGFWFIKTELCCYGKKLVCLQAGFHPGWRPGTQEKLKGACQKQRWIWCPAAGIQLSASQKSCSHCQLPHNPPLRSCLSLIWDTVLVTSIYLPCTRNLKKEDPTHFLYLCQHRLQCFSGSPKLENSTGFFFN